MMFLAFILLIHNRTATSSHLRRNLKHVEHQESVNVGNNKYIPIPNSSVSYDPTTKEVTSFKDNQYIEHGSIFNGETSSTLLKVGTIHLRQYLYYGGAGLKMSDGHLYLRQMEQMLLVNQRFIGLPLTQMLVVPKNPGKAQRANKPTEPKAPTPPTIPEIYLQSQRNQKNLHQLPPPHPPGEKNPPPPVQPHRLLEVVPNTKPVKPEAEVKWHKNKVVRKTEIPPHQHQLPPTPSTPYNQHQLFHQPNRSTNSRGSNRTNSCRTACTTCATTNTCASKYRYRKLNCSCSCRCDGWIVGLGLARKKKKINSYFFRSFI